MKTFRIDVVMSAFTVVFTTTVHAFIVVPTIYSSSSTSCTRTQQSPLQMAGFGGDNNGMASSSSSKKGKMKKGETSSSKLKPRKQWDRFLSNELQTSDSICVAVRVQVNVNENKNNKWLSVGEIKSKDNMYTEASVIRHRVLIADHARRMFPAEIRINDKLEWGYNTDTSTDTNTNSSKEEEQEDSKNVNKNDNDNSNDCWTIVRKLDEMPNEIDKLIGFRGFADPTGFYSSTGTFRSKASGNMKQTGYTSMQKKGIAGHSPLEVHD
mmetsp:Transcript_49131/g.56645  ORF Transcript_49131/g.56645 Transcript_49131/m.56645 type:complete len:267 (+) Transcript_49131:117-917(+)